MSWHNRACGTPDRDWTDGYPTCIRCSSSASSIANGVAQTPPPAAPPQSLIRSQLRCSWPPCVEYSERFIDTDGNDVTAFITGNIDGWKLDATDLPDDQTNLQEEQDASQQMDGSREEQELSRAFSKTPTTEIAYDVAERTHDKLHTVALGPTSTQHSDKIHEHLCGSDSFRVLRLYGSVSFNDPIHGSLEVALLDDPDVPLYDALSYTWADLDGNKQNCMPIYIGSHFDVLFVTKNCESALRRLRKSTDRLLWIDAICINQNDSRERSEQVSRMAKIYSTASRVLIYLGGMVNKSAGALPMVTTCSPTSVLQIDTAFLEDLARRPYFKRLWIIQEVAMATRASVICGDLMMHWSDLCSAFQSYGAAPEWTEHFSAPVHHRGGSPSIFELLRDTKDALCIDPRDKLFGIIGLANTTEKDLLPIDYSLSAQQLYIGLAAYWIQRTDNLSFLNLASDQRKIIPGLPSWVPDWTNIKTQESNGIMPTINISSHYAIFPHLFWKLRPKPKPHGCCISVTLEHIDAYTREGDLLNAPPLVQSTTGALLCCTVPLFKFSRGELKTHGAASSMRVATWRHMPLNSKLSDQTNKLFIFGIPSCGAVAILKKHGTAIFSLQSCVSLIFDPLEDDTQSEPGSIYATSTLKRPVMLESVMDYETTNLRRWVRVIFGLQLSLSITSESTHYTSRFPYLSSLGHAGKFLKREYGRLKVSQAGFNRGHFKAMDRMRSIMVDAIDSEDLVWRSPIPVGFCSHRKFTILPRKVQSFAEQLPARQESVEEQIRTWSSSVAHLRSQLQEQGSFSDAFRDLQRDDLFNPIFRIGLFNSDETCDLLMEFMGFHDGSEKVRPKHVHLSLFLGKAYSVISRATLDEDLPWDYNRDRFWMCMVSFDLIVRLRLLLADRQLYSRIERSIGSSIANPNRIAIV